MNNTETFTEARRRISRGLIEKYLSTPGAYWKGDEFWTLNPLRTDKHIGSFHISDIGQWYDHAINQGGDLIELLSKRDGLTLKQAAEKIIEDSGGDPKPMNKNDKKKTAALIPIPEEAFPKLNERLESKWSIEKYGDINGGWKWRDNRGVWCCTARHEKNGSKDIIPYYYGTDGKWRQGNPITEKRPIYKADELPAPGPGIKILIVEGEKCAEVPVEGYFVTTWIGGTGQVKKTNWKTLKGYDVTIWPDNDIPGMKAVAYIKEQLSQARILKIKGKPDKWDIYDAHKEGINLQKFIEENSHDTGNDAKILSDKNDANDDRNELYIESDPIPFIHLGYDDARHYFLPRGANIVKRISQGSFNKTKLLELAPLSWWCMQYMDKKGFDVDVAIDTTIRDSERHGIFQPSRIRGTGVWMHGDRLVINNGNEVTDEYGSPITPDTQFYYVKSDKRMGNFSGEISTVEQGYRLTELFTTQGFETEFEALALLGWTLIAPFGGILRWRPHVWLTGPAKSGKSWILENIVQPMVSPFFHRGTGKTSSPGIYRSIKNTACPILLDEMEPGKNANKETIQKIEEKLELARNASSDFSSVFTLTSMSGSGLTEEFCVRSCFCFASILPYFSGEAIESRIILSRLKNIKLTRNKIAKTRELMTGGVMADPMIYQRRIFRKLKFIIKNIDVANEIFLSETGDQRKSDNLAPIFAAIYALLNDTETVDVPKMKNLISTFINDLAIEKTTTESDEDRLLFELLDFTLQLSPGERVSIAELILEASNQAERISDERHNALQRNGIRTIVIEDKVYLAIASSHSAIKRILSDTMYHSNYYEVLKRHEAKRITQTTRFAGQAKRAVLLDWNIIKERYFTERNDDDQTPSLFVNEALNVF